MPPRPTRDIVGYEVPIRLGTWQRIQRYGAPRMYSYAWLVLCLWLSFMVVMKLNARWLFVIGVLWASVQGILAVLTWWNVNFDNALIALWRRRYQTHYRAG